MPGWLRMVDLGPSRSAKSAAWPHPGRNGGVNPITSRGSGGGIRRTTRASESRYGHLRGDLRVAFDTPDSEENVMVLPVNVPLR